MMTFSMTVEPSLLKGVMYFGKTYCNPTELLERTVNYQKFKIPHEVLLDEGAIMYSLPWLFSEETLGYLKDMPRTWICDRTGRETVYKVSRQDDNLVRIDGPSVEIDVEINQDGSLEFFSYQSDELQEALKILFDYDVH